MTMPSSLYLAPMPSRHKPARTKEPKPPATGERSAPLPGLYHVEPVSSGAWKAMVTAAATVGALFFMLPLTRYISKITEQLRQYNSISVVNPPPPPLPEVQRIEEVEEKVEAPTMEATDPEPITLSELQAYLHVSAGTTFAGGAGLDQLFFDVSKIEDLVFEIEDLDRVPRLLSANRPVYPYELKREKVEGEVVLLVMIDENGDVKVLGVKSSTHRGFELPSIRAAQSAQYTPPIRKGEKVKVRFHLPFTYRIGES